jgi:hypothetical protein
MKQTRCFPLACALVVLALIGTNAFTQTTAQKPATTGTAARATDQDLNIRAYIELLRSDVKSEAKDIVAEVMQLEAKEAKIFWPIYREYEQELSKQGDRKIELIRKYVDNFDSLSDATADQLVQSVFELEQARYNLKKTYYERFKKALSATTAARFLQINNQLLMLIDLQISSALPVVK